MTALQADPASFVSGKSLAFQPLLSVIVPVFNGELRVGQTLQRLQNKMGELEPVMWEVEYQRSKMEAYLMTNGTLSAEQPAMPANHIVLKYGGYASQAQSASSNGDQGLVLGSNEIQSRPQPGDALSSWYEVIVINDGSLDNTRQVVESASLNDPRIRLISYSVNMGKGYAIKQGVLHSRGRYILFMDGDGDISADVLATYLTRMSRVDIAIGSKNHPHSIVSAPRSRRIQSKCFQLFVKILLDLRVTDSQVGLKAGRGDTFRKIFERVIVNRYAFDAEMLVIAALMDLKIAELPVNIDLDRSFRKKDIIKMALDVFAIAYRLKVLKWYQKNMDKRRPNYDGQRLFRCLHRAI